MIDIAFDQSTRTFNTRGMSDLGIPDLLLVLGDPELAAEGKRLLEFIGNHVQQSQRRIAAGETMAYGLCRHVPIS